MSRSLLLSILWSLEVWIWIYEGWRIHISAKYISSYWNSPFIVLSYNIILLFLLKLQLPYLPFFYYKFMFIQNNSNHIRIIFNWFLLSYWIKRWKLVLVSIVWNKEIIMHPLLKNVTFLLWRTKKIRTYIIMIKPFYSSLFWLRIFCIISFVFMKTVNKCFIIKI